MSVEFGCGDGSKKCDGWLDCQHPECPKGRLERYFDKMPKGEYLYKHNCVVLIKKMSEAQTEIAKFMADNCSDMQAFMLSVDLLDLIKYIETAREKLKIQNDRLRNKTSNNST